MNGPPDGRTGPREKAGPATPSTGRVAHPADIRRRRRISRALDRCCGIDREPVDLPDDCWHVWGMDLGVPERERAGRAAA